MQINRYVTYGMWTLFGPLVRRNKIFFWALLTINQNVENRKQDFSIILWNLSSHTDCTLLRIPIANGSTIFW